MKALHISTYRLLKSLLVVLDLTLLLLAVLTLSPVIPTRTAHAYVYAGVKWANNTGKFDAHALTSTWVSVVDYGRTQWNNVTPSPYVWLRDDTTDNDITYEPIDGPGDAFGATARYSSGSTIFRVTMKFDSAEDWYTGTGTPSDNQVDARSTATHEFGHGLGLSHSQVTYCPGNSTDATMCSGQRRGETIMRSLATDDINGANAIYP